MIYSLSQVQIQVSPVSDMTENFNVVHTSEEEGMVMLMEQGCDGEATDGWTGGGELLDCGFWNEEDMWFLQQQFGDDVWEEKKEWEGENLD